MAPELLNKLLVHDALVARIIEVEAYAGSEDPGSHAYRGPTGRNATMFGPPGHLYVYFTYGMHYCMNVATGRDGEGSAVLLRAAEPLAGIDVMSGRRGGAAVRSLCSGPARLAQAFGVARAANGADLVDGGELWVARGRPVLPERTGASPRVGIRVARDRLWRFFDVDSVFVSRPTIGRVDAAAGAPSGR